MPLKAVLINGAPYSGKDTAAEAVIRHYKKRHIVFERFSMPLKIAFAALMGASITTRGEVAGYEGRKDTPLPELNGLSYRQWQIAYAEEFLKPRLGPDVFAKSLCRRVLERSAHFEYPPLVLVPDCGFSLELPPVVRLLGAANVMLLRLSRPGHMYFDSRQEVTALNVHTVDLTNDGDIDQFEQQVNDLVRDWDRGN